MAELQATETTELDDHQSRPPEGDRQPLDERGEPASALSRAVGITPEMPVAEPEQGSRAI